jgi:hypothetical protein
MWETLGRKGLAKATLSALALALVAGSTGCQMHIGGQTLPSAWYQTDDVQYFAPGPEFKLANEAAALKARQAEAALEAGPQAERPGWTQPRWR